MKKFLRIISQRLVTVSLLILVQIAVIVVMMLQFRQYFLYFNTICTALSFVDHRMKNLIDRLLPLVTMGIRIADGQCRHVPRYDKHYRFGLLYAGAADRAYLNRWMERVMLNFDGESLGAYPIEKAEEVLSCI